MARQSTHGTLHKLYYYLVVYAATQKTFFFRLFETNKGRIDQDDVQKVGFKGQISFS